MAPSVGIGTKLGRGDFYRRLRAAKGGLDWNGGPGRSAWRSFQSPPRRVQHEPSCRGSREDAKTPRSPVFSISRMAVKEGFKAMKWPYHQAKEAPRDPSETSPGSNVAEPSRLWLGHVQREDAAAGGLASSPPREGTRPTARDPQARELRQASCQYAVVADGHPPQHGYPCDRIPRVFS